MPKLDMEFVKAVEQPIHQCWSAIGYDVQSSMLEMEEGDVTSEIALESVIDANRLSMYGTKEADQLIHEAIQEHGYDKVFNFLLKHFQLGI